MTASTARTRRPLTGGIGSGSGITCGIGAGEGRVVGPYVVASKLRRCILGVRDSATGRTRLVHVRETRPPKNLNDGGVVGCGGDLPCKDGVEDSSGREYTDLLDAKQLTRYYTIYSSPPGEEEWLGGDEELGGYGRAKDRDNNEEEAHREEANPKETGDKYPVDKQSSPLDIDCRYTD
ncbi:hypothetical protein AAG570_012193 [Ranatra chinensis]|uniref:Uncharacterized protein n=1 Tax=Ranatra chinensis TaxID=642074 RepID=A0ABD0YI86_9HEMI